MQRRQLAFLLLSCSLGGCSLFSNERVPPKAAAPAPRVPPPPPSAPEPIHVQPKPLAADETEDFPDAQAAAKLEIDSAAVGEPVASPSGPRAAVPEPTYHPLVAALTAYLEGQPEEAMRLLSCYQPRDQELLLRLLPIIARVELEGLLTENLTADDRLALLETLRSLTAELRTSAPLVIDKLVLYQSVRGFGQVEPRSHNVYRPTDKVRVYAEIQNLVDLATAERRYVVRLASELEIFNAEGKLCKTLPVDTTPDYSWTPRTDHFCLVSFTMPRDLEPGSYVLRVRFIDQDTRREAEKSVGFRVAHSLPDVNR